MSLAALERQLDILAEQFELLREEFKITGAVQMLDRFHAFDAIKDDKCPCCGARVAVKDNGNGSGVKLEAVV